MENMSSSLPPNAKEELIEISDLWTEQNGDEKKIKHRCSAPA